jgi:hypothetical protein
MSIIIIFINISQYQYKYYIIQWIEPRGTGNKDKLALTVSNTKR